MLRDFELPFVPFVFAVFISMAVAVCLLDGVAAFDVGVGEARPNEVFHAAPDHILALERATRPTP